MDYKKHEAHILQQDCVVLSEQWPLSLQVTADWTMLSATGTATQAETSHKVNKMNNNSVSITQQYLSQVC